MVIRAGFTFIGLLLLLLGLSSCGDDAPNFVPTSTPLATPRAPANDSQAAAKLLVLIEFDQACSDLLTRIYQVDLADYGDISPDAQAALAAAVAEFKTSTLPALQTLYMVIERTRSDFEALPRVARPVAGFCLDSSGQPSKLPDADARMWSCTDGADLLNDLVPLWDAEDADEYRKMASAWSIACVVLESSLTQLANAVAAALALSE